MAMDCSSSPAGVPESASLCRYGSRFIEFLLNLVHVAFPALSLAKSWSFQTPDLRAVGTTFSRPGDDTHVLKYYPVTAVKRKRMKSIGVNTIVQPNIFFANGKDAFARKESRDYYSEDSRLSFARFLFRFRSISFRARVRFFSAIFSSLLAPVSV